MIRNTLGKPKTLVVTSRVPLIDQWKKEFEYTDGIDYMCIQSAYKLQGEYELVIIDEVHRALSPNYRAIFTGVKCDYLLGLTATKPQGEESLAFLNSVAPIVYEKVLSEIVEGEVLPEFKIMNVEVPLIGKEAAKYKLFDGQFTQGLVELSRARASNALLSYKYSNAFDMARELRLLPKDSAIRKSARKFWSGMSMRKNVVYNNSEKIHVAVDLILRYPNRRWICFTKSIAFAEELAKELGAETTFARTYHSKMTTAERAHTLKSYRMGRFNVLIAVDALNEGLSIDDVDTAICLSGVSTHLTNTQQLGRILRAKEGKKPIFINLYSRGTVERTWVEAKTVKAGLGQYTKWYDTQSPINLD